MLYNLPMSSVDLCNTLQKYIHSNDGMTRRPCIATTHQKLSKCTSAEAFMIYQLPNCSPKGTEVVHPHVILCLLVYCEKPGVELSDNLLQ